MALEQPPIQFEWILGDKIRDGHFGPVYTALRSDTGELIAAEKLVLDEPGTSSVTTDRVLSRLETKQIYPNQPNVVSYLGHQLRDAHIFTFTEYLPGGTLWEFIQKYRPIPLPLARSIIRQLLLGLEQLQTQGFAVVFLDSNNVFMDSKGGVKIAAPLLDITFTGQPLPPTILSIPELKSGQANLRKADIWLLGILGAQLLTGKYDLGLTSSASTVAGQTNQIQASTWIQVLRQGRADTLEKAIGPASDFVHQCFTTDIEKRPSISDLKEHPFLSVPSRSDPVIEN